MKRFCLLLMISCGSKDPEHGGSGVDPTLAIGTLATADAEAVCDYAADLSRAVTCGDRQVQSVATLESCLDLLDGISDTCETTIAELEQCFEALAAASDAEVCDLSSPAACEFLGDPSCLDI